MSGAAICTASQTAASRELVPVHAKLVKTANTSNSLVMDETSWRIGGKRAWLWVATNADLTCYWVTPGRGFADATQSINADYTGVIVRDGYVVYDHYTRADAQTCLVHLLRNSFQDASRQDSPAIAKALKPIYTAPTEAAGSSAWRSSPRSGRPATRPPCACGRARGRSSCRPGLPPRRPEVICTTNAIVIWSR